MKLKIKNLNWHADKLLVLLNEKTTKKMNVFTSDRIAITYGDKKVYVIVDIFSKLVKPNEIGISFELSKILKLKNGAVVDITSSELSEASVLIKKKLEGHSLTKKEMEFLVSEIVHNNLREAEIAFFTAAEKLNGMNFTEIVNLTRAMVKTGAQLTFKDKLVVDKHCIGGVAGNRTTPVVVSICAALGMKFPKTSSRAITSAAGTADTIETIANIELSLQDILDVVNNHNGCLAWGGSLALSPSDDKIIQVERLLNLDIEPQLLASVTSKKIAAGAKNILIDIPYGKGVKVKSLLGAQKLGRKFRKLGKEFKLNIKTVYTDGSQPIGNGVGPMLEILDVISVLKNKGPYDLEQKALYLATEILKLCKIRDAKRKVYDVLLSGEAYEKFQEIINAQNKNNDFDDRISSLVLGKYKKIISAKRAGRITYISNKGINSLCRILGTPETHSAGVYIHKHVGPVKKGEQLLTLYTESKSKLKDALKFIKGSDPIEFK
jgi:AMP phosphorylase